MLPNVRLLDTTLRDGSYEVNFDFSREIIGSIMSILEEAGVEFVEIGHGLGIGAHKLEKYHSPTSDLEHAELANSNFKKSKWGMFCIPGIATLREVEELIDAGMGFIRIGTDIEKHSSAMEYIKLAKEREIFVCHNFMKSYTLTPQKFVEFAMVSEKYGADLVYIVDSAGGMLPSQVERYIDLIKEKTNLLIGFHGHDNLGLAMANSLQAIKSGVFIIDGTMQGIGRGAGNASTEALVAIFLKYLNSKPNYDINLITNFSRNHIKPLFSRELEIFNLYCGIYDFHSSFQEDLFFVSNKVGIPFNILMREYTKIDKTNFSREKAEKIAIEYMKYE